MRRCLDWTCLLLETIAGMLLAVLTASIETPANEWSAFFATMIFGVVPVLASLTALRSRKRAAQIFFLGAAVAALFLVIWMLLLWHEDRSRAQSIFLFPGIITVLFVVPGAFWFFTYRKGWPPLRRRSFRLRRDLIVGFGIFATLLLLVVMSGFYLAVGTPPIGDCGAPPPITEPESANSAVFTAKIIYVYHAGYSGFSIAKTEHRYWGLPWWNQRYTILPFGFFHPGDEYFVEGSVRSSLVGHLINIMRIWCSRTAPVKDAQVDLRLLRDGPPKKGVRIIGRVLKPYSDGNPGEPAPHVAVTLTQDSGPQVVVMTDDLGIYDAMGLPPGHYAVRLNSCMANGNYYSRICSCSQPAGERVEAGHVWGCTLRVRAEIKAK